jgi:hypothetical protein
VTRAPIRPCSAPGSPFPDQEARPLQFAEPCCRTAGSALVGKSRPRTSISRTPHARRSVTSSTSKQTRSRETTTNLPGTGTSRRPCDSGPSYTTPKVWPTQPLSIDGTWFALFVTTTADGQAAVADLGPLRLALYGPVIPDDLTLKLAHLSTTTFEDYPHDGPGE